MWNPFNTVPGLHKTIQHGVEIWRDSNPYPVPGRTRDREPDRNVVALDPGPRLDHVRWCNGSIMNMLSKKAIEGEEDGYALSPGERVGADARQRILEEGRRAIQEASCRPYEELKIDLAAAKIKYYDAIKVMRDINHKWRKQQIPTDPETRHGAKATLLEALRIKLELSAALQVAEARQKNPSHEQMTLDDKWRWSDRMLACLEYLLRQTGNKRLYKSAVHMVKKGWPWDHKKAEKSESVKA